MYIVISHVNCSNTILCSKHNKKSLEELFRVFICDLCLTGFPFASSYHHAHFQHIQGIFPNMYTISADYVYKV